MGVKRRRIPLADLVKRNGVLYVKQKNQHHRVCECRVVHRNCVKCNKKLARRKSDYILLAAKHAEEYSKHRQRLRPSEDHAFSKLVFYKRILAKIREEPFLCECFLCLTKGADRQRLSVRGPNKFSVDRLHDRLGYTHPDQVLRFVSKAHHSWQKRDLDNITSRTKRKWLHVVKYGIVSRSKRRYARTLSEISSMESAGMNVSQMKFMLKTHEVDHNLLRSMLENKKRTEGECQKCGVELDYGDENGFLTQKNNPRQASPDRVDNRIGYTPTNVRMVCCSCQTMGTVDEVEDVYLDVTEVSEIEDYLVQKIEDIGQMKIGK